MNDDPSSPKRVGAALRRAREVAGISKREAARRANVSEATWRNLETGEQPLRTGQVAPMNPRPETLVNAARAVGLEPAEVLRLAGRDDVEVYGPGAPFGPPAGATERELLVTLIEEFRGLRADIDAVLRRAVP